MKKLALPLAAAGTVAAIMFGGWQYAENAVAASKVGSAAFVDPETLRQERSAKAELDELQRAKRDAPAPVALPVEPTPPAQPPLPPPEAQPPPPAPAVPTPRKRDAPAAVVAAAPAPTGPTSAWDAIYGGRDSFNNPTAGAAAKAPPTTAATTAATAGIRVPVRLDGAIASSPSGPVIAVVTQETKVGGATLPVGTQVHGQTSGTSGPRILVTFNFAIVGGQNVPLRGIAMSPDNRAGIPGTRTLGGASDVAAGGAQGAVSGLMDAAASVAGDNPAGDALRGAANPTSGKAARLNNEEEIVTTKRGARFVVYVGG